MSTKCNVAIKLDESSLDKMLKFKGHYYFQTHKDFPVLEIYVNHDGDPESIGKNLVENLGENYDDILQYILQGDRISFKTSYIEWGESWTYNQPASVGDDIWTDENEIPEEFYYLFINGKWYFRKRGENLHWYDLKEYLQK